MVIELLLGFFVIYFVFRNENGSMKLTTVKFDGIVNENRTGKDTWFNALCLLHPAVHKGKNTPWDVVFGDYSRFVDEEVVKANGIMQQLVRNLNFCCFLNFFFKI